MNGSLICSVSTQWAKVNVPVDDGVVALVEARLGDRVHVQASVSDTGVTAGELPIREGAMGITLDALAELKEC